MKSTADQLAQRLVAELGAEAVSSDADLLTSHGVDGKQPALVCTPDREQASAALRLCAEAAATVTPWGGGTAMALGNPPRQVDVVLDTARLDRVIDHDPANLTVTVESGITLPALQSSLSAQRQFVPVDPPFFERSTLGGIVAGNLNGPRRSYYGSVRDLVIGMKVSLISGERIKAGGKVVKNVAGYDMCKLFVGSLGTLGVITEVTLRLAPLPESSETALVSGDLALAQKFADQLLHSPLLPAAVVLFQNKAPERWQIAARFEGFVETISRCRREVTALADRSGMPAEFFGGEDQNEFWQARQNVPLQSERLVFRLTLPRAEVFNFIQRVKNWHGAAISADAAIGTVWLSCQASKANAARFTELTEMAHSRGGHVIISAAPSGLKHGLEVWGLSPPTLPLMRRIKHQFDPAGLLNPGRFVGSL